MKISQHRIVVLHDFVARQRSGTPSTEHEWKMDRCGANTRDVRSKVSYLISLSVAISYSYDTTISIGDQFARWTSEPFFFLRLCLNVVVDRNTDY